MSNPKSRDLCRSTLDEDTIAKLDDLVRQHGSHLIDWQCYGQPQPDAVYGVTQFQELRSATELLDSIAKLDPRFRFEIFPFGIPVPEWFQVVIEAGDIGRRARLG